MEKDGKMVEHGDWTNNNGDLLGISSEINGGQMGSVQKYTNGTKLFLTCGAAPNKVGL
jgi:hypothetical protein